VGSKSGVKEEARGFRRTMGVAAAATPALSLPDEVREFVAPLARGLRVPHRLVRRAQIVQLAAAGVSTCAIARQVGCSESMVRKWRGRMAADPRGPALEDAPRSGRPATISLAVRLAVLRLGCDVPPDGERQRRFREVWMISSLRDAVAAESRTCVGTTP
jgi:Winged helix-turn helix